MKIIFNSVHFDADQKLIDFATSRIEKLETFYSHVIDAQVIFKIEKDNDHGNKVAEIKLNIPSQTLFSKNHARSFEEGIDSCVEALRRQIKKVKETRPQAT